MKIAELIQKSHAMAVEKGWWNCLACSGFGKIETKGSWTVCGRCGGVGQHVAGRSVVDQTNNFHAEVSEAWEEYRHGRMETWYMQDYGPGRAQIKAIGAPQNGEKPEGFWVEIADLMIRLGDTFGAYDWDVTECSVPDREDVPEFVSNLHMVISAMCSSDCPTKWDDDANRFGSCALTYALLFAERNGVDLWAVIHEKMAFNATRPIRHGGLKA